MADHKGALGFEHTSLTATSGPGFGWGLFLEGAHQDEAMCTKRLEAQFAPEDVLESYPPVASIPAAPARAISIRTMTNARRSTL